MAYNCRDGWPTIAEMSGLDTPKYTNKEELNHKLYELYSTKVMQINKKAKANNSDIIDYVKIMYGLNVNAAMISYV